MPNQILLEVLIPTFNRPQSAQAAIQTILDAHDPRIAVRCHSNQPEPDLEDFCLQYDCVAYGNFPKNRGPGANSIGLYMGAKAKFCMLLSDEDRLHSQGIPQFLDYLEALPENCNVITCSVTDSNTGKAYYSIPALNRRLTTLAGYTNLSSSTYMSGYTFRTKLVQKQDLPLLLGTEADSPDGKAENVYSFIDISQRLLVDGVCGNYMDQLVLQGPAIKEGGHAFQHRDIDERNSSSDNLDLNPAVYGPYARTCQFFYREWLLTQLRSSFPSFLYKVAEAKLYCFFYEKLLETPKVVVLQEGQSVQTEANAGVSHMVTSEYFSNSNVARLFIDAIMHTPAASLCYYEAMSSLMAQEVPSEIFTNFCFADGKPYP